MRELIAMIARNAKSNSIFLNFAFLAFFAIIFLFLTSPAWGGIRIQKVTAGIDGYIRGERWLPVVFQVEGVGGNFQGSIEVGRGATTFHKSVDLSAGAKKRIELLIYQTNYYEPLEYRILDENIVLLKDKIETRALNYQDNIVLVLTNGEYNHQFLNGVQNPWGGKTFVSYMDPTAAFTEAISYSVADAVALGDISLAELAPAQRKALLIYGAMGGTLICSSATHLSVLQDPAIAEVLPVISPELSLVSHGEFLMSRWSSKSTDSFPPFTIPIQEVHPRASDNVLVNQTADFSLVSSSPFYKGNIVYFAFDYTRMPEAVTTIFPQYWNELIYPSAATPPAFGLPSRPRLEEIGVTQAFLNNIPGLKPPDVKWFALFFFVYLIAIGPLQYFILTRLKKNSLLWTTFPLIILVFTGGALGYSKVRRSADQRIRQVQVVEVFPELHLQHRYQCFGTALSESGTFTYQAVPENSFMIKSARQTFNPLPEPFVLTEDLPHRIVGEDVKTWAYRMFDASSVEGKDLPLELSVRLDGNMVTGTLVNHGKLPIQNARFVYDSKNSAYIGTIDGESSRTFAVELNNTSAGALTSDISRLLDLRSLSLTNPHFFVGELGNSNGEVVINGKKLATDNLEYVAVYVNIAGAGLMNPWPLDYGQQMMWR